MVVKDPFRKINISMKRFKAVPWRRQSYTTKWSRPPIKWATRKLRPILWAM